MKKLFATFLTFIFTVMFSASAFAGYDVLIDDSANLFTDEEIDYKYPANNAYFGYFCNACKNK